MPRITFQVPDDLTKELAEQSKKIYKTYLNKMAVRGWETRDDLIKHQKDVVKYIQETYTDNFKARGALSAVFWILHEVPNDKKKSYYNAFQKYKDPYDKEEAKKKKEEKIREQGKK